jgi:AcrR family transcriptional regulator
MASDVRRAPGRPRDPEVERAILRATQDLLIENGYARTTVAEVASRAGTGKAAIYRRWPGKIEVVVAAVRALASSAVAPDTGSLREDLLGAAMHYARADERSARVLASLLTELGRDAELYEAAREAIGGPPVAALTAVIDRWIARGVVEPTVPVALFASIVPTVAFGRVSLQRRALDPATVVEIVDRILLPGLLAPLKTETPGEREPAGA